MREALFSLYRDLETNHAAYIFFFRNNKRFKKTFAEFGKDIDLALSKLNHLKRTNKIKNVAIIGPVSYDWIVCDMACIKGGFLSIAIPEHLSEAEIENILDETKADIVLVDYSLNTKYNFKNFTTYSFECGEDYYYDFWLLPEFTNNNSSENLILEEYSIVFSSGTSESIKRIKKIFQPIPAATDTAASRMSAMYLTDYKGTEKKNKLIISMPFSHAQQRDFFRIALFKKIDIVLSDYKNCIKHIITEKPNIMVSVPVVYEAMAERIRYKISNFSMLQKLIFRIFIYFKINTFPNTNYLKIAFSALLFKQIKKIYGSKADYFVTGSAPISCEVIETFYNIGVKILQAYGQTETGNIAMSTSKYFKIGSVGKPLVEIKISSESEILVRYNPLTHAVNANALKVNDEGFIHTGDLGYLDNEGFLFIEGRIDDVIVLENGKKVYPQKIETLLKTSEQIKEASIFCTNGYRLYVVINCLGKPDVNSLRYALQSLNNSLAPYERIYAFHISEKEYQDNGLLTANLKKKRKAIKKHFINKDFISI